MLIFINDTAGNPASGDELVNNKVTYKFCRSY